MRFFSHRFLIALLCLSGCVSVPDHDLAQVAGPVNLQEIVDSLLPEEDFAVGQWPSSMWWETFADPQLNELIETALREAEIA